MSLKDNNLQVLHNLGYGVEEQLNINTGKLTIDLYDPKHYFVDQFKNHEELADWISENIKEVK